MSAVTTEDGPELAQVTPEQAVRLRGDPPRVMRLSRKAVGIAAACSCALVGGALIYALRPESRTASEELYDTSSATVADNLASAPASYDDVPQLGPPLPGDLGGPILEAQRRGDIAALPPVQAPPSGAQPYPTSNPAEMARQRAEQEREAARERGLFNVKCSGRSRETLRVGRHHSISQLPDLNHHILA